MTATSNLDSTITIDNSGDGGCGYHAYAIGLFTYLYHQGSSVRSDIYKKLSLSDPEINTLNEMHGEDDAGLASLKSKGGKYNGQIEKILSPKLRKYAVEKVLTDFENDKTLTVSSLGIAVLASVRFVLVNNFEQIPANINVLAAEEAAFRPRQSEEGTDSPAGSMYIADLAEFISIKANAELHGFLKAELKTMQGPITEERLVSLSKDYFTKKVKTNYKKRISQADTQATDELLQSMHAGIVGEIREDRESDYNRALNKMDRREYHFSLGFHSSQHNAPGLGKSIASITLQHSGDAQSGHYTAIIPRSAFDARLNLKLISEACLELLIKEGAAAPSCFKDSCLTKIVIQDAINQVFEDTKSLKSPFMTNLLIHIKANASSTTDKRLGELLAYFIYADVAPEAKTDDNAFAGLMQLTPAESGDHDKLNNAVKSRFDLLCQVKDWSVVKDYAGFKALIKSALQVSPEPRPDPIPVPTTRKPLPSPSMSSATIHAALASKKGINKVVFKHTAELLKDLQVFDKADLLNKVANSGQKKLDESLELEIKSAQDAVHEVLAQCSPASEKPVQIDGDKVKSQIQFDGIFARATALHWDQEPVAFAIACKAYLPDAPTDPISPRPALGTN